MENHWNTVYSTKQPTEVSWYEAYPQHSVDTIVGFNLPKTTAIIDVGGGDSRLVDALLDLGYTNLTVLDISAQALERAKVRLGTLADAVNWVVSDVTQFRPDQAFTVWHDRATFHFLTTVPQLDSYLSLIERSVVPGGFLSVATFSDTGPTQCSGLTVRQYSPDALTNQFIRGFARLKCEEADHLTPFQTYQRFTFCQFQRR